MGEVHESWHGISRKFHPGLSSILRLYHVFSAITPLVDSLTSSRQRLSTVACCTIKKIFDDFPVSQRESWADPDRRKFGNEWHQCENAKSACGRRPFYTCENHRALPTALFVG